MGQMLCLPAPYGDTHGVGISLRRQSGAWLNDRQIATILVRYGCYLPSIPRIISSLFNAGRYDCRVVAGAVSYHELIDELADAGVDLTYTDPHYEPSYSRLEPCCPLSDDEIVAYVAKAFDGAKSWQLAV